jgi:hypothetical protein
MGHRPQRTSNRRDPATDQTSKADDPRRDGRKVRAARGRGGAGPTASELERELDHFAAQALAYLDALDHDDRRPDRDRGLDRSADRGFELGP